MVCVVQNKMGGSFMNIEQYQEKIYSLLKKLEEDMPKAERLEILQELKELLSAFFV